MGEFKTMDEFLAQVAQCGGGASQFDLRNENKQKRQFAARFSKVKKEKNKKARLLFEREVALPFNPTTGVADEQYNRDRKFRPAMAASTVAGILKKSANVNEALKKALMAPSGTEEWDTSEEALNEKDLVVFKPFLFLRTYSIPSVTTKLPGLMKNGYNINFMVDIKRDENDEIILEPGQKKPLIIQAGEFYAAIASEKIKNYEEELNSGERHDDENTQKNTKAGFRQESGVGLDGPTNLFQVIEIPLNSKMNIDMDKFKFNTIEAEDLKKEIKVASPSKNLSAAFDSYTDGTWENYDVFFDFIEIDMKCGSEEDTQQLAKNTQYTFPMNPIRDSATKDRFVKVAQDAFDSLKDIEAMAMRSSYLTKYDADQEVKLAAALAPEISRIVNDPNSFCTQAVLQAHKDFIFEILGEDADDIYAEIELGTSDRKEGSYVADADGKQARKDAQTDLLEQMNSEAFDEDFGEDAPTEEVSM